MTQRKAALLNREIAHKSAEAECGLDFERHAAYSVRQRQPRATRDVRFGICDFAAQVERVPIQEITPVSERWRNGPVKFSVCVAKSSETRRSGIYSFLPIPQMTTRRIGVATRAGVYRGRKHSPTPEQAEDLRKRVASGGTRRYWRRSSASVVKPCTSTCMRNEVRGAGRQIGVQRNCVEIYISLPTGNRKGC